MPPRPSPTPSNERSATGLPGCGGGTRREITPVSSIGTISFSTCSRPPGSRHHRRGPMPVAIVTGSGGLIGSESVAFFVAQGFRVLGLDNDMRAYFLGPDATTMPTTDRLVAELGDDFEPVALDIRDGDGVMRL